MIRSALEKDKLRKHAVEQISEKTGVQLAAEETTGGNDFKHAKYPNVCGVVVDKGSAQGWIQIQGGNKTTMKINTGPGENIGPGEERFAFEEISDGQSCMLYGCPTVLYICPQT